MNRFYWAESVTVDVVYLGEAFDRERRFTRYTTISGEIMIAIDVIAKVTNVVAPRAAAVIPTTTITQMNRETVNSIVITAKLQRIVDTRKDIENSNTVAVNAIDDIATGANKRSISATG